MSIRNRRLAALKHVESTVFVPLLLALLLTLCCFESARGLSFAFFGAECGYGSGIDDTWMARVDGQWKWEQLSANGKSLGFETRWQTSTGIWRGDHDIFNASFTPILRLQYLALGPSILPYLEGAVGFHYISETRMRNRVFSTNFQFGDHLGVGIRFGRSGLDICYQFQHLSNASIKRPNAGINFHILRIGLAF